MPKASKIKAAGAVVEQIKAIPEGFKTPAKASQIPPNRSEKGSQAGLRVEYRPIEVLIPYARNPRTHSDEQVSHIAASVGCLPIIGKTATATLLQLRSSCVVAIPVKLLAAMLP